ncbi:MULTISPECIES: hypothetical protein [unclassified Rhodococcus (in: high G+C Gram-positive bacteria)]
MSTPQIGLDSFHDHRALFALTQDQPPASRVTIGIGEGVVDDAWRR